jgi:hypothetical protein
VGPGGEVTWRHGAVRKGVWALRGWCDTMFKEVFLKFVRVTMATSCLFV